MKITGDNAITWAQIDLVAGMMDCLYAECVPCITDCVVAELEKLGQKYRVALKVAKVRGIIFLKFHLYMLYREKYIVLTSLSASQSAMHSGAECSF